jgi:DnaJ-class molecular chaperone
MTSSSFHLGTFRAVKGQGMVNMRTHDAGDLIVQFEVEFPAERFFSDTQILKVSEKTVEQDRSIAIVLCLFSN